MNFTEFIGTIFFMLIISYLIILVFNGVIRLTPK